MSKNNVIELSGPEAGNGPITALLRVGAMALQGRVRFCGG